MALVSVINGPNLNLLSRREPEVYGHERLDEILSRLEAHAKKVSYSLKCVQSNSEGVLVDAIHDALDGSDGIIINAGAYSHTSIAIRDALSAFHKPIIEVHISNIYRRESFRHRSYVSDVAHGVISGLGGYGYILAFDAIVHLLKNEKGKSDNS